jgi:alkylation response protein AidB-like acyl-CoA dehydrogenase
MDFELNDDQRMLQEGAARYLEKQYDFKHRLELGRTGGFSRETWNTFAEMGWLAASVPEEHGGLGFGPIEVAVIAEQLGRNLVLEPFTCCGVLPAAVIAKVGTTSQKNSCLPSIATGEKIFAVAHSEPDARGDVGYVSCSAERSRNGWTLTGHKSLVVGAPIADQLLVVARTEGEASSPQGLSIFKLSSSTPGVKLQNYALADGTPAADIVLEGVRVDDDAILGEPGAASAGLQHAIDEAIVAQCAETVGSVEDVLALCSEYLKTRKQFGVPIGSFQALQHRMADMAIEATQARASLHRGLQSLTQGAAERRSIDVSGVKAQVARSARFVTQQGIQLHGGYGITEEYRVGHHWRRMLLTDSVFGSAPFHLARYARRIQQEALEAR